MLFPAFLAASAATLVVASYEDSEGIALRSLTGIEERDELLGGLESLNSRSLSVRARSTIAREVMTVLVDMEVATPMYQEEARSIRIAGEAMRALRDMEVATPMYQEEARSIRIAGEAIPAPRDMEVATPGMEQISGGVIIMAREAMSFRDRKA
ncbi:unnamed protein product [Clonostachys rhizophaga]|uniref:Uncharacterized protein n=1 Tax=Clonostachys rhizophaga TaxID=160324 RepID=A0A9N9VHB9_9HYPO|nr:unnamed protein product [Clonostachys rhizophaga]